LAIWAISAFEFNLKVNKLGKSRRYTN